MKFKNLLPLLLLGLFAACGEDEVMPVYELSFDPSRLTNFVLMADENSLYCYESFLMEPFGTHSNLTTNALFEVLQSEEIRKIVQTDYGFFLMGTEGILFSGDLQDWETRNDGLNLKTIKHYDGTNIWFTEEIQDLKDFEVDPMNSSNIVTASKEGVFVSTDAGLTWDFEETPSWTPGLKSCSIFTDDGDIYVLIGDPYQGIYRMNYTHSPGYWKKKNSGLYEYDGIKEEISDILAINDGGTLRVFAANSYTPRAYELDIEEWTWTEIYSGTKSFDMTESLSFIDGNLHFISMTGPLCFALSNTNEVSRSEYRDLISVLQKDTTMKYESVAFFENRTCTASFNELWLFNPEKPDEDFLNITAKKGVYIPGYIARDDRIDDIYELIEDSELNMITIDMKDDYGKLRFEPESELLLDIGSWPYSIDVEEFVSNCNARDIYLVARIVLFKDKHLYSYDGYKYALKDVYTGAAWQGYEIDDDTEETNWIAEYWVDPYCEEVWEYNVEIARELIDRGFDEIQFDYIRFPTDGINKWRISCDYQDEGMDKESAIISFLNYARERLDAPISIDIYGSNGWHRITGVTGQDVDLLSRYVDVICPMHYPSHHEQDFLAQDPAELRPFRIYYYGALRNFAMARGRCVIRPWAQAFYMSGYSYDRKYYDSDYILREIQGCAFALDQGYTFWNSGGVYDDLEEAFELYNGE